MASPDLPRPDAPLPVADPVPSPRLEQVFEGAPDPIVVVDERGLVVAANPRVGEVLGYSPRELLGSSIESLVPRELRADHVRMREEYMASPRVRPMGAGLGLHAQHRDGHLIPVEICLSPCESEGRRFVIATLRDVSNLHRMEDELRRRTAELERSNRDLEQFAYVASHDLQEPLRHVTSFCEILRDDHAQALDEDGLHCLDAVTQATGRMRELISDLLDYSRAGRSSRPPEAVDLRDVLDTVLDDLQPLIHASGAEVVVGALPVVHGTRFHLSGIFQNLLGNAVKFRREGVTPRIDVQARRVNESVWRFSVRDNGIGIDPQHVEQVFDVFQKLHPRQRFQGTGIGLAIVRKAVEYLGGRVWVESTPGEGSTFVFELPDGAPETR